MTNLVDNLVFYGEYHRTTGNKIIHIIFVPMILWTAAVLLCYFPLPEQIVQSLPDFLPAEHASAASCLLAVYVLFYLFLEPVAGLTGGCLISGAYYTAHNFYLSSPEVAWKERRFSILQICVGVL